MDLRLLEKSRVGLRLNISPGVAVPSGSVVQSTENGNKFSLINTVLNSSVATGDFFTSAIALEQGPKEAKAGTLTKIVVPIPGWNSVTNDSNAILPGDIDLSTGDLVLTAGLEEIRQNIKIRLRFNQGEWFLNTDLGIPYFGTILTKNPNLAVVRSIIRDAISGVPGVKEVSVVETEIITGSRDLNVRIEVLTDLNQTVSFEDVLIF